MPTAIPELIALELKDRLEQITTDNGYSFDVESVVRLTRKGEEFTPKHLRMVIVQAETEKNPELSYPGNPPTVARDVTYHIRAFVRASDSIVTPKDTTQNDVAAAIEKAIASDGIDWYTMDGNAVNSEIGGIEPFEMESGDHAGVSLPVVVTYRVRENDPYTVAT